MTTQPSALPALTPDQMELYEIAQRQRAEALEDAAAYYNDMLSEAEQHYRKLMTRYGLQAYIDTPPPPPAARSQSAQEA